MLGCYNFDGSGFNQISRGTRGWDHAKITHLMARNGHSEETSALTHEVISWNMPIVNPTDIGPTGDVSNALGIFSGGTRGTSTTDGCTETVPPNTNWSLREKQRLPTPNHTDAWIDSRCHHSSPSWLKILNYTPQTCFQHPALRGWTGAFRCGQGQSDVRRKKWCLMGVWKWIQFGVPDSLYLHA